MDEHLQGIQECSDRLTEVRESLWNITQLLGTTAYDQVVADFQQRDPTDKRSVRQKDVDRMK